MKIIMLKTHKKIFMLMLLQVGFAQNQTKTPKKDPKSTLKKKKKAAAARGGL